MWVDYALASERHHELQFVKRIRRQHTSLDLLGKMHSN